jgi:hypothetical protein
MVTHAVIASARPILINLGEAKGIRSAVTNTASLKQKEAQHGLARSELCRRFIVEQGTKPGEMQETQ